MDFEEAYFGCDCMSLDHVSQFLYFPPDIVEDETIYLNVKITNYLNRIVPYFSVYPYDWGLYFKYNILKRFPISFKYILNRDYTKKYGIFDSSTLQNKDLSSLSNFLNNLTSNITENKLQTTICLNNEKWQLGLVIDRIDKDFPYELHWEIQFIPRNLFGRIKYALKYIFGKYRDEQCFEINIKDAAKLKGMIEVIQRTNDERTKSKN